MPGPSDRRHIEFRAAAVAEDFEAEQRFLSPLPGDGFDTGAVLWPRAFRNLAAACREPAVHRIEPEQESEPELRRATPPGQLLQLITDEGPVSD